jgi:hypothetical protein
MGAPTKQTPERETTMTVKFFITGRNVETEMSFADMRAKFVAAGECKGWNWEKLEEALNAGFRIVMPLGIEIYRA